MQGFGNNAPVQSPAADMLASNSPNPSGMGSRWKGIDDFYAEDNTKQRVDEDEDDEDEDEDEDEAEDDDEDEEGSGSEEEEASETDDHGKLSGHE
jgi:hypothetical protein